MDEITDEKKDKTNKYVRQNTEQTLVWKIFQQVKKGKLIKHTFQISGEDGKMGGGGGLFYTNYGTSRILW